MSRGERLIALLALILAFTLVIPGLFKTASADPATVDVKITRFEIENLAHESVDRIYYSDSFYLAMDWDASSMGADVHEGDSFDVTLPDEMRFPSDTTAQDFDILGADGTTVLAKAHVTPGADDAGGTVHVVFTDAVEDRYDVKGTMYLAAQFNREKINRDETNVFTIMVNADVSGKSDSADTGVVITGPKSLDNEYLNKWGQAVSNETGQAQWWVRINHTKATLTNATVSDHLSGGAGNETYIEDSFVLQRVNMNEFGGIVGAPLEDVDLTGKLSLSADKKSFTIDLGTINGDQYRLTYMTTYTPGTTLKNNVTVDSVEKTAERSASYQAAASGGTGEGSLASKIKLVKVDAEDNSIALAGAVFEVVRPDGTVFELTTGADGTVVSGVLTQGVYVVREILAPKGYELNDDEFTLEVTPSGGAIRTITDQKIRVDVQVEKRWDDANDQDGKRPASVTVHLFANGVDTDKTATLDEGNGWMSVFPRLDKFDADGVEIEYTVTEDEVDGYTPTIAGGVITNTRVPETVSIPVTKTWVGPKGTEVTVGLVADGTDVDGRTVVLNEANSWKNAFNGLPKYKDGKEIAYTVTEKQVSGVDASAYTTSVTGNATDADGFTITNTNTETVDVNGVKYWDDDNDRDAKRPAEITVRLLADGAVKDSAVVEADAAGEWSYSFPGLPKYTDDGAKIAYEIEEDEVPGYTASITGDVQTGFTVTNSYSPETISIPVVKKWEGKTGSNAVVRLYADGQDSGKSLTLDADSDWKGSFNDLPKYADGKEIAYTLTEDAMAGYEAKVSGDAHNGFTVTNTFTEKKLAETGSNGINVALASLGLAVAGTMALGWGRRKNA